MRFIDIAMPFADDQMSMDVLHAEMIGKFFVGAGIRRVTEVGCCHGISTGAVLDAIKAQGGGNVHLIDPVIQPTIRLMIDTVCSVEARRIAVLVSHSTSLASDGDSVEVARELTNDSAIILDGDHSKEVVKAEIAAALAGGRFPRAFVFHDCGLSGGLPGPQYGVAYLVTMGYRYVMDEVKRPGMRTERGLAILCRDDADIKIAREVMQ